MHSKHLVNHGNNPLLVEGQIFRISSPSAIAGHGFKIMTNLINGDRGPMCPPDISGQNGRRRLVRAWGDRQTMLDTIQPK